MKTWIGEGVISLICAKITKVERFLKRSTFNHCFCSIEAWNCFSLHKIER